MKVAINKCYGGFGLSADAVFELVKMKSKIIDVSPVSNWETTSNSFTSKLTPFKEGFTKHPFCNVVEKEGKVYGYNRTNEGRGHPDLIKVIEELKEKANGELSKIVIVNIPDDVEWEIDDYDGIESIHEKHRSW